MKLREKNTKKRYDIDISKNTTKKKNKINVVYVNNYINFKE